MFCFWLAFGERIKYIILATRVINIYFLCDNSYFSPLFQGDNVMHKKAVFISRHFVIYILWMAGFAIGLSSSSYIISHDFSVPYMTYSLSGSFGGMFICSTLPLLIAVVAYAWSIDFLSNINLLVNGFLYGFCSLYLSRVTGFSGSFVHLLFMFSTGCCATLLLFICAALDSCSLRQRKTLSFVVIFTSIILCCLDYFLIFRFST